MDHLKQVRKQKHMSIRQLSRQARLDYHVVYRAERAGVIPTCQDFKAWVAALGLSWDRIWSECLCG